LNAFLRSHFSKATIIMTQSTVLILGANGRLGVALVTAFAAHDWRVLAQSRRAGTAFVPTPILCDLRDVDRVTQAARTAGRVDVVIHAANVIYTRWEADALAMNDAAVRIATTLGATLILPGNVYNFGAALPETLLSNTPQNAQTSKGQIRVDMECALFAASKQGTQALVIRAGDFFGCGVGSWFDQAIAKDVHKGKLTYPGPLDRMHAWAYVPDLAATFVRVAEARKTLARFESIHFAGHAVTGDEFVETMQQVAPRKLHVSGMPWWFIRAVGVVKPVWRDLAEMSYLWRKPHRLITDDTHARLIAPTTPLAIALRQSLAALHPTLQWAAPQSTLVEAR
jgi:nucleoside-diphosphate-sugar epimerase